jgi:formylglycine-generating enzyme required for sulfatase activity
VLAAAFALAAPSRAPAQVIEDDGVLKGLMVTSIVAHDVAIPAGLIPSFTINYIAESTEFGANLLLKAYRPLFEPPGDLAPLMPNTPDQCGYKFVLPRAEAEFENILGIITIRKPLGKWKGVEDPASVDLAEVERIEACLEQEVPGGALGQTFVEAFPAALNLACGLPRNNWGILGPPARAWHANTGVIVKVASGSAGIAPQVLPQVVRMPAGVHRMDWVAETQLSPLFDVGVPAVMLVTGVLTEAIAAKWTREIADALDAQKLTVNAIEEAGEVAAEGVEGAARIARFDAWKRKLRNAIIKKAIKARLPGFQEPGLLTEKVLDKLLGTVTTATSDGVQFVSVYDVFPPTITADFEEIQLEATDFGGTRTARSLAQLEGAITIEEECGRDVNVSNDLPGFLPLGSHVVTWRVEDLGPNPGGENFFDEVQVTVVVADTQPPLLLAPPSKVIETANSEVPLVDANIGFAAAVDLADPQPQITQDAPPAFAVNSRTTVTWTATDASANQTEKTQLVTVKPEGANTTPVANDTSASTLSSEPVDILLTASDTDEIDGRFDPLWFTISNRPDQGEFVAPLFPFFIEDYRTNPTGGLGPLFESSPFFYMDQNYCSQGLEPPYDFVYEPAFVHVRDDGVRLVLDHYIGCNDPVELYQRLSLWDPDGNFISHRRLDQDQLTNDSFVVDRNGVLYFVSVLEGGSSSAELQLTGCDLSTGTFQCNQFWSFDSSTNSAIDARNLAYARVDSERGLVYFTDQRRVFAFEIASRRFLGVLTGQDSLGNPVEQLLEGPCSIPQVGSRGGFGMEVDAQGSLYVADSCGHRIHKFAPPGVDDEGETVLGAHLGWAGRCLGSTNLACDDAKQRSKGFACTDDTCCTDSACALPPAWPLAGEQPGQFDHPLFLALDPNDVLYVADYDNFRIQRFAPDGSFAGEAVSAGTGINQGERPSFVLGNMDRPRAVSVNSSQFYIVDRDEKFLHVFGTLPFKDLTDSSAVVTYVSNNTFHSGVDEFQFKVSDGLAESAPATVEISVARNFRPPIALGAAFETVEDVPLDLVLEGADPDGIAGVDFNGLDTLTFEIATPPQHGELEGEDTAWTYTPGPGFAGDDVFTFRVNDGVFESPPATVTIHVEPANDPPEVTIVPPGAVARGFPILIEGVFLDEPSELYEAELVWGDGSTDPTGTLDETGLTGVAILASGLEGSEQMTLAKHDYQTLGVKNLTLCVTDDQGAEGCDSVSVTVENLVRLGLAAKVTGDVGEVPDGVPFSFTLEVANGLPSIGGMNAENVILTATVEPELTIQGVSTTAGSCSFDGVSAECAIGTLPPDDVAQTITLTVVSPGTLIYDAAPTLEVEATTTTPSVDIAESMVEIDVIADLTDSDGDGMPDAFEAAYGLDPDLDDSGDDLDGDLLTNLAEYEARTNPAEPDTDGDDVDDGAELAFSFSDPLHADTDIDGMPDGWEIANGLNPLLDDSELDSDNDGVTNLDEYLAGTLPRDTDGDGIPDYEDNCFLPNPLQEDADGNGIGDGCDCQPVPFPGCLNPEAILTLVPASPANDPDSSGLGGVDYPYGVSIHEVTNAQYLRFLEAVASVADPAGLYHSSMEASPLGGIRRLGSPGAYTFMLEPNMANKPVNFVSWLDAARYVNWLDNGRPAGAQSAATTETGAFDLTVADPGASAQLAPDALWSLPTEDEWYKAAYFEPPARYYLYPTRSDIEPRPIATDGLGNGISGDVNYFDGSTPQPIGLVSVGTGEPGSESPSGTTDQAGNVSEWLAADAEEGLRIARGGSFRNDHLAFLSFPSPDRASMRFDPATEVDDLGFRVVFIPEPSIVALQLAALGVVAALRRRRGQSRCVSSRSAASAVAGKPATG